jgi:hypothetical protein
MAGNGPPPKDPRRRARRNADPNPTTTLRRDKVTPPKLPAEGPHGLPWPAATRSWFDRWKASPQAAEFSATDWDFLLDTAVLHAALWRGDTKAAPELRLRVAKFGATVEDRARLRMTFAAADEADAKRARGGKAATQSKAKSRFGDLRLVEGGAVAAGGECDPKPKPARTRRAPAKKG